MEQAVSLLVWDQDDPLTAKKVTEAIEGYQSVVIPCSSAAVLLSAIQHKTVDVVILNLQKPFEKAFHLLAEIKTKAPHVEVIFVSRFDKEALWRWMEVIQRGAYEFLPKPLDVPGLKRLLVQVAEKHHPVKLRKRPAAENRQISAREIRQVLDESYGHVIEALIEYKLVEDQRKNPLKFVKRERRLSHFTM